MSPAVIGLIGFGILLVCIFLGVHIGFSLIVIGLLGALAISGISAALANASIVPFSQVSDPNFAVMPLFMLMSEFISAGGIGAQAYVTARAWFGQLRGGLAMASVAASGLFAAVSGSSIATAIVMGRMAYPEMKKYAYSDELSSGCLAAGGSLGIMIPPSIQFIVIGILTEVSIGKLFMAGIIPGLTQVIFYIVTIAIMCRIKPSLGPAAINLPMKEKVATLKLTWPVVLLFIVVIGGIYGGIFSPQEAGAIGAFGALLVGLTRRKLSWSTFYNSLKSAVKASGMLLLLLIGAFVFNRFMAVSRIPTIASQWIVDLGINAYYILIIVLFLYIILGMFLDITAMLILTVPIFFPSMVALGFDPVWYGVLMCRVSEMGFISPPFGINLFGLAGVIDVPLGKMYRGVIPFLVADTLHLALLIAIPAVALFIPNLMK
jgi:C4-dicarboxylate transporter, DctM subunit